MELVNRPVLLLPIAVYNHQACWGKLGLVKGYGLFIQGDQQINRFLRGQDFLGAGSYGKGVMPSSNP